MDDSQRMLEALANLEVARDKLEEEWVRVGKGAGNSTTIFMIANEMDRVAHSLRGYCELLERIEV